MRCMYLYLDKNCITYKNVKRMIQMDLKYIYIKQYKQFENLHIDFSKNGKNILKSKIYNDLNFTVFVGDNGSGKTTILSFISIIFRNLQRYHDKIPSDFKLIYILDNNHDEIAIEKNGENIHFNIGDKKNILLEFDARKRKYIQKELDGFEGKYVIYDDIKKFLPKNIIVSGVDIEYPKRYTGNYIGHRILEVSDLTSGYTNSGIGMEMSKGLLTFMDKYLSKENIYLKDFFDSMGFSFSNDIYIYLTTYQESKFDDETTELFYRRFNYKNWEEFLSEIGFKDKDSFINWISSDKFWEKYIEETDNTLEGYNFEGNVKINIKRFIDDNFFNKEVLYLLIEENIVYINDFFILKEGQKVKMDMLSTGEKILLCRLFFILSKIGDNSLIILEEPEIHLNTLWVQQLITIINFLFSEYNAQFLISTHNHSFINKLFPEDIVLLKDGKAKHPDFNTFFANESEIKRQLFPQTILKDSLEDKMLYIIGQASEEELKWIIDILGESYLKYMVFQRLNQSGETPCGK